MSRHLTDEQLTDALEGAANALARRHVESCPSCASRIEEARDGLRLAREADVPEPPPLYWEAFRRNVERRIVAAEKGRGWRRIWLPVLAAAAGLALIVPALRAPGRPSPSPVPVLPAWSALPPADEDTALAVLEGVALAEADLPIVGGDRGVAEELARLSDEEAWAVRDALRSRLAGDL